MKRILFLLFYLFIFFPFSILLAQDNGIQNLREYFEQYTNPNFPNLKKITVEDIQTDAAAKKMTIVLSDNFIAQPVTPLVVGDLYNEVKRLLPMPFNTYNISIVSAGSPIEQLIPTSMLDRADTSRVYKRELFKGNPWVTPMSHPYSIKKGLQGRHLGICHSHGKYFSFDKKEWIWQRPRLFCTTEDMFTQTFVVPYLIPMLQNAGAVVFSPRERDWQKQEIIVDNDFIWDGSRYEERVSKYHWQYGGIGFGHNQEGYENGENPFRRGTFQIAEATKDKRTTSDAVWIPEIPVEDDYAVYVSYQTMPNSIPDAIYTVKHGGTETEFRVNQQMGGGTWVYIGTFDFDRGSSRANCVILNNVSNQKGVVTADAVRFGGGMGNITRGGSISGMPRCLEGARYFAQWAGAPYDVYSSKNGQDDYADDINVRSYMTNWLGGGSRYMPNLEGKKVPIELSLAVHSDAGYAKDFSSLTGSLSIYTTNHHDGLLNNGESRSLSKTFATLLMNNETS